MSWQNHTNRFSDFQIGKLEQMDADEFAQYALSLGSIDALHAVTEVLLNKDFLKLYELLLNVKLTDHWSSTELREEEHMRESVYMNTLRDCLKLVEDDQ
jgi:hypothetical protein